MITLSSMDQSDLFEKLKNPKVYGPNVRSVDSIQTHISFIALTGANAYKIKKEVNFGFLDFSTLKKRKYFCEEEIRLNRRLCPDIYLEVLPITKKNNHITLDGSGEIIEYTVKMKEFSQICCQCLTSKKPQEISHKKPSCTNSNLVVID